MFGIGEFFKKIQGTFAKEVLLRDAIRQAVLHQTGGDVPIHSISFKSDAIILSNVSQSLKSVVYIKKRSILKEIAEKQNIKVLNDIR